MPTTGLLTRYDASSPNAALVLAHGAGAGQRSPFMTRFARGMVERGISAATFDFAYMEARKSVPDKAPVLEQRWRDVIAEARDHYKNLPLFIGGKSMGGRIASHVAAQGVDGINGLVFLGYPLHPPGKPAQRRDAHLPQIMAPMLFVQGTRDAFGTAADIESLLPSLRHATLHAVDGGDHSFKVPKSKGDAIDGIMDAVQRWILPHVR
jgi:predicted alpha/beta-hydrolase family hydrolase